jgi:large subunit ribosomal protein LX
MSEEQLKPFRIRGRFMMGGAWQMFSKEFCAMDEDDCTEQAYSILGSRHGVKRKLININRIEEIKNINDIQDPIIKDRMIIETSER